MNTHPSRRQAGFTLIELLVVISIIAALAGAGFTVGLSVMQKAKKTKALATCLAIEQAVNNFYTEYEGTMPSLKTEDTPTADPIDTTKTEGIALVRALLGNEGDVPIISPQFNTKGLRLLSIEDGKRKGTGGFGGLVYDATGATILGIFDPWGGPYHVVLDLDYDEKITVKPKASDSLQVIRNGRRVAVWSNGADGVAASGKAVDDVKTW